MVSYAKQGKADEVFKPDITDEELFDKCANYLQNLRCNQNQIKNLMGMAQSDTTAWHAAHEGRVTSRHMKAYAMNSVCMQVRMHARTDVMLTCTKKKKVRWCTCIHTS